jgi:hypothetical protein
MEWNYLIISTKHVADFIYIFHFGPFKFKLININLMISHMSNTITFTWIASSLRRPGDMLTSSNLFSHLYFPSFSPPRTSFMQCVIFLHKYLKIQRYSMIYSKSHHFVVSHIYIYIYIYIYKTPHRKFLKLSDWI